MIQYIILKFSRNIVLQLELLDRMYAVTDGIPTERSGVPDTVPYAYTDMLVAVAVKVTFLQYKP